VRDGQAKPLHLLFESAHPLLAPLETVRRGEQRDACHQSNAAGTYQGFPDRMKGVPVVIRFFVLELLNVEIEPAICHPHYSSFEEDARSGKGDPGDDNKKILHPHPSRSDIDSGSLPPPGAWRHGKDKPPICSPRGYHRRGGSGFQTTPPAKP